MSISYAVFCLKKKKTKQWFRSGRAITKVDHARALLPWIGMMFFFLSSVDLRDLHSFPTRRSSDLRTRRRARLCDAPAALRLAGGGCLTGHVGRRSLAPVVRR